MRGILCAPPWMEPFGSLKEQCSAQIKTTNPLKLKICANHSARWVKLCCIPGVIMAFNMSVYVPSASQYLVDTHKQPRKHANENQKKSVSFRVLACNADQIADALHNWTEQRHTTFQSILCRCPIALASRYLISTVSAVAGTSSIPINTYCNRSVLMHLSRTIISLRWSFLRRTAVLPEPKK